MLVTVTIDNREKEFVKTFSGRVGFKFENMDIGDFKFNDSIYIERKTFSDMAASIKDGRYREQKLRLKSLVGAAGAAAGAGASAVMNGIRVIYLIENDGAMVNGRICGLPANTLMGAMTKCMLRDGFFVFQSSGVNESVKFIEKIKKQMESGEFTGSGSVGGGGYVSVVKTEKKANMTAEMCYLAQLKQIPGISSNGALAIKGKYSSMKAIFDGYRSFDELDSDSLSDADRVEAKKLMMSEIKVGGRRLGKKTSAKIYGYLFCDE